MNRKHIGRTRAFPALLLLLTAILLCGCADKSAASGAGTVSGGAAAPGSGENAGGNPAAAGPKIVATIFPEYDWTREILGDLAEESRPELLIDNGVDPHSFQPGVEDLAKIADCDLLIYVGGTSDAWVEKALAQTPREGRQVLRLMDILGNRVREEETVEGMEPEDHEHEAHGEGDAHGEGGEDAETPEYDEHVWLSLKNAVLCCEAIGNKLEEMDQAHAAIYRQNTESYKEKLQSLDKQYTETVSRSSNPVLLFGDRFPFRYLTEDYGILYYAAFPGCSAETEASFETVTFLAGKADELHLKYVLTIDGVNHRLAETIVENTADRSQQVLSLNSMQSVSRDDIQSGTGYLSVMEQNLEVLKKALDVQD